MKNNAGRRVILLLITVLTAVLSQARAAGADEFGQGAPVQTQGGAHEFGQ